jgi:hypothetical protein
VIFVAVAEKRGVQPISPNSPSVPLGSDRIYETLAPNVEHGSLFVEGQPRYEVRAFVTEIRIEEEFVTLAVDFVISADESPVVDLDEPVICRIDPVAEDGSWVVVQQGMNGGSRQARRYHWLSAGLKSFVEEPHIAIEGPAQGDIINLTDRRAGASRRGQLELLAALGPDGVTRELAAIGASDEKIHAQGTLPFLVMAEHHDVRATDVHLRRLRGNLAAAAERGAADFPDLLLTPGVGARTVRALALVAEVVHGAPCRFSDPARFSLAHGGKDRHPFPVPLKVYDETVRVLRSAVQKAKLGQDEELAALQKLDAESRKLERAAKGPAFEDVLAEERAQSHRYGGRSVFGWEPPHRPAAETSPGASAPETIRSVNARY